MRILPLSQRLCEPATNFLIDQRRQEARRDPRLWLDPDLQRRTLRLLVAALLDDDERIWVAVDTAGRVTGVLGARARNLRPDDLRRTFLPQQYGLMPVVTMGIEAGWWSDLLPDLWEHARNWLFQRQVEKPQVWLNTTCEEGCRAFRKLGFQLLMVNALYSLAEVEQPLPAMPADVLVRLATKNDIRQIIPLFIEELQYHADLPGDFWVQPDLRTQGLAHREIELFLQAGQSYLYLVAERLRDKRLLGYMNATVAPLAPDNPNIMFFPPGRGLLQVASVTEAARGHGLGTLLFKHLMAWFYRQQTNSVSLSYDVRNPLSGPFWQHNGFIPLRKAYTISLLD